jgi:hypothetical protein
MKALPINIELLFFARYLKVIVSIAPLLSSATVWGRTFDMLISCHGPGEVCTPVYSSTISSSVRDPFIVSVTAATTHCSDISYIISIDGGIVTKTPFLSPGERSDAVITATEGVGNHAITVQGIGEVGGCNFGTLISWGGTLSVQQPSAAVPVNFRQVGQSTTGGVFTTYYDWDSSSGKLTDLQDCNVGEYVSYEGRLGTFPWPAPWLQDTANPTVNWWSGTFGRLPNGDIQRVGKLSTDYVPSSVVAHETFRLWCKETGIVDFASWESIEILRKISDSTGRGCWGYTLTKGRSSVSIRPLPGVKASAC